jgi:hypothetical protein
VLDGDSGRSVYHAFPMAEFSAAEREFEVFIGPNRFSSQSLDLDLDANGQRVCGSLRFDRPVPWPVTWLSPGIMGWYSWAPGMECYHGVLSFDHRIDGALQIDGQSADFSGGRGYIEKDWGQAFPSAYVWFQSNHFEAPGACITASVAVIPWKRTAFRGFIAGLWLQGKLHRFATYTGAKITRLNILDDRVEWTMESREHVLELIARRAEGGELRGPTRRDMSQRIDESLSAAVEVRLLDRDGQEVFIGTGRCAGLEVNGDLSSLA